MRFKFIFLKIFILVSLFFYFSQNARASEVAPEVKIFNFNKNFSLEKNFFLETQTTEQGAYSLATVDLGGDKISEIVIGAPAGDKPEVKIYRYDGSLINKFLAYNENFRGGINVAAADLDNDGKGEIITGAGIGGGPHIRIFDGFGKPKITTGFFAFDKNLRNGVNLAVADINGDGQKEIIAGSGPGINPQIRIFKLNGELIGEINLSEIKNWSGVNVASADLNGDGQGEIIVAPKWGDVGQVQILDAKGNLINKFLAYSQNFRGGVNLFSFDLDNDGRGEILTGAGAPGGPHVRIFDNLGNPKFDFFAYDQNFRGGVLVAVGKFGEEKRIITLEQRIDVSGRKDLYKYIDIDISEQKLRFYESGFKLGEHLVSTGMLRMPTPLGTFKIFYKSLVEYSRAYDLYMPHFMQFTRQGAGIHGLPYWLVPGKKIYEGVHHLGLRVSHGCVRLPLDAAEKIYYWADLGTIVIVHP
jgi:lipoprotein-anchoring transpeptidase ErfK/SrfK